MPSEWIRPVGCEGGACVEYRTVGDKVFVRNSDQPEGLMEFTAAEWDTFVAGLQPVLAAETARLRQDVDRWKGWLAAANKDLNETMASLDKAERELERARHNATTWHGQWTRAQAEVEVLRHRDRRTQAVVEAAKAWLDHQRSAAAFTRRPHAELIRLADALDALEDPPSPPESTESAEQPQPVAQPTDGPEPQGEARRAERTCGAEYVRLGGRQRGDRIVRCDRPEHVAWESHQEGETGVEWYEPEVAAAYGVPVREPRVWNAGDPEPKGVVHVRDREGVDWHVIGLQWWTTGPYPIRGGPWPFVLRRAPLTEVLPEPTTATGGIIPAGTMITVGADPVEQRVPFTKITVPKAGWYEISGTLPFGRRYEPDLTKAKPVVVHLTDEQAEAVMPAKPDGEVPEAGRAGEAQRGTSGGILAPVTFPEGWTVDRAHAGEYYRREAVEEMLARRREDQDRAEVGLDAAIEAARDVPGLAEAIVAAGAAVDAYVGDGPPPPTALIIGLAVRAASPLIERAALNAAADAWSIAWINEGTGFPEGTDGWLRDRASRTETP